MQIAPLFKKSLPLPLVLKPHQRFLTISYLNKVFLKWNDSFQIHKFKKIRSLPSSLDINISFGDKIWNTENKSNSNSLSENVCIIRATNLIFIIYIQIKSNEICREYCLNGNEYVDMWVSILLALKSRNLELFFLIYFRFSCLLVRDPSSMALKDGL